MVRIVIRLIAILAAFLGVTVLVDTVFADGGTGCCPKMAADTQTKACKTDVYVCAGATDQSTCLSEGIVYYEIQNFPKGCVTTTNNTKCDEPNANCYRNCSCQWMNGTCSTKSQSGVVWTQATQPTTNDCPP